MLKINFKLNSNKLWIFRFIFAVIFSIEAVYLTTYSRFMRNYHDYQWYLDSGKDILGGTANLYELIYSPLFSIFTFLAHNRFCSNLFSYSCILFNFLFIFLLALIIYEIPLITFKSLSKYKSLGYFISILFILLNPYMAKYSLFQFSESSGFLIGTLFAIRYANISSFSSFKSFSTFLFRISRGRLYYMIIIIFSFYRYTSLFLLISSVIFDLYLHFFHYLNKNRKKFIIFYIIMILSALVIFLLASSYPYKAYEDSHAAFSFPSRFITYLITTMGFRESLAGKYVPSIIHLFNYNFHTLSFSNPYNYFTFRSFLFSISMGLTLTLTSLIGFFGLSKYLPNVFYPSIYSFLLLVLAETIISSGHYRYFMFLLPSINLGFSIFMSKFIYSFKGMKELHQM